jgi:hypothetical protein
MEFCTAVVFGDEAVVQPCFALSATPDGAPMLVCEACAEVL